MTTEVKVYTVKEQKTVETKLKETGYTKTSDCMWNKICIKGNLKVVVSREW